jgi:hypothetical protein
VAKHQPANGLGLFIKLAVAPSDQYEWIDHHAGRLELTQPIGASSEFSPADHAKARQEFDAIAAGKLGIREAGEAIGGVEDEADPAGSIFPSAVSHELNRTAERFFEAIRHERLALLGLKAWDRPRGPRPRPGCPDISVEAETSLRDVRIQVEAQEVWLFFPQHLLQSVDRRR